MRIADARFYISPLRMKLRWVTKGHLAVGDAANAAVIMTRIITQNDRSGLWGPRLQR